MALKTFERKFIAFLHATSLDQDGIDSLIRQRQSVFNQMAEIRHDGGKYLEYLQSTATLEKVRKSRIAFILIHFYSGESMVFPWTSFLMDGKRLIVITCLESFFTHISE
jgi:hypothetical protein